MAAVAVGDALGLHIVRKGRAARLLEQDLLTQFLREFAVDCVFDVGANVGQYASLLRRIGFRGFIISFEPIPNLAKQLRLAAAKDRRWFVEALALDESEGDVVFNVMAAQTLSSLKRPSHSETSLFEGENVVVEAIPIRTSRLEKLFDTHQKKLGFQRPFLKMDTQGSDLAVARGAGDRLQRFVGLQSELSIKRIYEHQSDYRESIDFFESAGFVLSGFFPNTYGYFPDLIETDCIMYNPAFRDSLDGARRCVRRPQIDVNSGASG